jgi:hypothetical protein
MDYKFNITNEGAGYRVQLINEFGRMVSWAWNSDIYAAVLDAISWQLKTCPGDVRGIIKAVLATDFKEIELSLKMEIVKQEFASIETNEKKEIYLRP